LRNSSTDNDVLKYLARNQEINKYRLKDEINRAYSGISNSLKKLLNYKMVKIVRTDLSERNWNIETKIYALTKLGLYNALLLEDVWNHLDETAQVHLDKIPLVFGKWDFFKEKGVLDIVLKRLRHGVITLYPSMKMASPIDFKYLESENAQKVYDALEKEGLDGQSYKRNRMIIQDEISYALTNTVLGIEHIYGSRDEDESVYYSEQDRIINIIKDDDELHTYFINATRQKIKEHKRYVYNLEKAIKKISSY